MWFGIISLFPEMFDAVRAHGVSGRAFDRQLASIDFWNPRTYTTDNYQTVDDRPYGGGPGMVMMEPPLSAAIQAAKTKAPEHTPVVYLSPQGKTFTQQVALDLAATGSVILLSGRYEGIDERVMQSIDMELSVGDFVLSGGELASMVVIDAITRTLPGALGHKESALQDSFMDGLLDCPHYTRPVESGGQPVPPILMSGNHALIKQWRLKQALGRTWLRRPDLLAKKQLTSEEKRLLDEFIKEFKPKPKPGAGD